MKPNEDSQGITFDQVSEITTLDTAISVFEVRFPGHNIRKHLITEELVAVIESLEKDPDLPSLNHNYKMSRKQAELAHIVLRVFAQITEDELSAGQANDMAAEIEAIALGVAG